MVQFIMSDDDDFMCDSGDEDYDFVSLAECSVCTVQLLTDLFHYAHSGLLTHQHLCYKPPISCCIAPVLVFASHLTPFRADPTNGSHASGI